MFSDQPTLAPALLKSCVTAAGFDCRAIDLNIEVYNRIKTHAHRSTLEDFFKEQIIDSKTSKSIGDLIEYCCQRILSYNPRVLGLSLLTQDCQFFTLWLCYHLKIHNPEIKIVIGGSGIKNFVAESKLNYAKFLKNYGYIDDYINGDGEYSLVEYLKNNLDFPGINSSRWIPIEDLNQLPFPNFDDYDFNMYADVGIPLCDSRGCVRSCEFCDVIEHWKKYQYRTADNIFEEMCCQIHRYGIRKFYFYNSLTNGNMKEFQKLLDQIVDYNDKNPNDQISWTGYFIVRNQKQHPETLWEKIKKSNGHLQLGIESVVEKVRMNLGKNFRNEDIDYHLEMAKKYQVPLLLLLIVGYPTETHQNFEYTKQWFRDRGHFAGDPVEQVIFSLAAILPNTELDRKQNEYGLIKGTIPTIWMSPSTQISTQDRLNYYNDLTQLLADLGFNHNDGNDVAMAGKESQV
jgi:radical SAM superfamily enzyme YgiQ (UPF0313 family)